MRYVPLLALLISSAASATPASALPVAVKCVGNLNTIPDGTNKPETRIFIIDDAKQMVFTWSAQAQAKMPICQMECAKKFGANQIRLIEHQGGSETFFDIERDTGAVSNFVTSSSPNKMETFEGTCEKTAMPRASGIKKF